MTDSIIRAPRFEFGAAVGQVFNLPGGKGYLFRVIGFGTLILIAGLVLLGAPIIKGYVGMFGALVTLDSQGLSESEEMAAAYAAMAPMFAAISWIFLLAILQFGVYISVETALYRNIIRGEDKGFFPLRFGMDEFKVLLTRIVVGLILYAAFFVGYIGVGIFAAMFVGMGAAADSTAIAAITGIIMFVAFLAFFAAMIYAAIRLAPSSAFAVRDEDFNPVASWGTMKSYFWPTFGAVLVVGVIGYIVLMVFTVLAFGLLLSASGIIPVLMALDTEGSDIPDFSPVLETLTSVGFFVPAIIVIAISTFLAFLYYGAIWSIWGYVAKLTTRG